VRISGEIRCLSKAGLRYRELRRCRAVPVNARLNCLAATIDSDRRGADDAAVTIQLAITDDEIQACYPVMVQLRPHVAAEEFLPRVRRQQAGGFQLAALRADGRVVAVAGYRLAECLSSGRYMYVDDLVTDAAVRSAGHGGVLLDWLIDQARAADCDSFLLDSGVQRFGAHRFYLQKRLEIRAHHFVLPLR
jgi:GNAT superfamily N-acetyltransferase